MDSQMEEKYNKMKDMVEDLRNQLFQAVQKNELLENEVQSSVRLLWAAAYDQPEQTLRIPKKNLETIGPDCQLESGYDPATGETFFTAIRVMTAPN